MACENGEIIAVLDGIDEISSQNYQSRWSYLWHEILPHHEFLPCVKRDVGCFVVDFDRISHVKEVVENQIVEEAEEMDEIAASEDLQLIKDPERYLSSPLSERRPRSSSVRRHKTDTEVLLNWKGTQVEEKPLPKPETKANIRISPEKDEIHDSE